LLGHCVQSIGNQVITHVEKAALSKGGAVPESIVQRAQQRVGTLIGIKADELDPVTLFRLADEISVQNGAVTDRDIFVAREGLCKGCAIALALLCLALLVRALLEPRASSFQHTFTTFRDDSYCLLLLGRHSALTCSGAGLADSERIGFQGQFTRCWLQKASGRSKEGNA
jgi:hypothetical protein